MIVALMVVIVAIAIIAAVLITPTPSPITTQTPTTTPTPTPTTIGLFRIGHNYEPDTLDLHATTWADITSSLIYGTYLIRDWRNGEFLGYLAERWWFGEQGKEVYIKLKSNLKFANGEPINASVIKYTYERMLSKNAPTLGTFGKLERVEVVDNLTAKLVFKEPFAPLLITLINSYHGVFPPGYIGSVGDIEFGRKPLSAGYFYVVEWKVGDYILYERNPHYIRRADVGGQGPLPIEKIQLKFIRDPAGLVSSLLAGDVDLITTIPPDLYPELLQRNGSDIIVATYPGIQLNYFGFNTIKWPFSDVNVRRAVSVVLGGTDIREGLNQILSGLTYPIWGPLVPTIAGYNGEMEKYAQDVNYYNLSLSERIKKAHEILKAAGWEDRDGDGILEYTNGTKFEFPLLVPSEFFDVKEAEFLTNILGQAGMKFNIQVMDTVTIRDKYLLKAEHYAFLYIYGYQDAMILRYLFHSTGVKRTWFNTPELDELLDKVTTVVDPVERQKYIDAAQKILIDNSPWVPLYAPKSAMAWRSEYTGLIINEYEGGTLLFELVSKKIGG